MCGTRLTGNAGRKISSKKSPSGHHRTTLLGCRPIFATKACIDNRKKLLHSNISSTCPHNMANFGPLTVREFGAQSKFQRVSRLAFVTTATSLARGQLNFARCLAVSCDGTLYIHFGGSCPLTEFYQVQNLLYVQVLGSRILAALLHATPAADVSQTLRR